MARKNIMCILLVQLTIFILTQISSSADIPEFFPQFKRTKIYRDILTNQIRSSMDDRDNWYDRLLLRSDEEPLSVEGIIELPDYEYESNDIDARLSIIVKMLTGSYEGNVQFLNSNGLPTYGDSTKNSIRRNMYNGRINFRDIEIYNNSTVKCILKSAYTKGYCDRTKSAKDLYAFIRNLVNGESIIDDAIVEINDILGDIDYNELDQNYDGTLDGNGDGQYSLEERDVLRRVYSDLLSVACYIEKARKDDLLKYGIESGDPTFLYDIICDIRVWMNSIGVAISDIVWIDEADRFVLEGIPEHIRQNWDRAILISLISYLQRMKADIEAILFFKQRLGL